MRAPRDAFRNLTPFRSLPRMLSSNSFGDKLHRSRDVDNDSVASSNESFESALSPTEKHIHQYTLASCSGHGMLDESESSDDEKSRVQSQRPHLDDTDSFKSLHSEPDNGYPGVGNSSIVSIQSCRGEQHKTSWKNTDLNQLHRVSSAYWPYWVYSMYDSYSLAQKAAGSSTAFFVLYPDKLQFHESICQNYLSSSCLFLETMHSLFVYFF